MARQKQWKTDLQEELQEWLSDWFSPERQAHRARERQVGLAMAMMRNENHLDVLMMLAKTERSTWHWELVQQTYSFFLQTPDLPMPKILQKWADDVAMGRRKPPKQGRGQPTRLNDDYELLEVMNILINRYGLTQDEARGQLQEARKENSSTIPSFSRFPRARERARELHNTQWNLIALREESDKPIDQIPDRDLLRVMQLLLNTGLTLEQAARQLQARTKINSSTILSRFLFLSGGPRS